MPVGLLGRKIGMTQVYTGASGEMVPVTVIEAGPCQVLQVRTLEKDGYEAVQIGFDDKPRRLAARSERGHVANLGGKRQKKQAAAGVEIPKKDELEPKRFIKEFRTDGEDAGFEFGQALDVTLFEIPEDKLPKQKKDEPAPHPYYYVDVIGTSKGRGFAGVMKRHNFSGQRASHGVKRVHRHGGSIGMSADPARVLKGTRMGGRYGGVRRTIRRLQIVKVDKEKNLLLVKGAVPGPNGGYVVVRHTTKKVRADYK